MALQRHSQQNEKTFRLQFEKKFDYLEFNMSLLALACKDEPLVIAFDPTYLPKSGKHSPCIDRFWSGCASRALRGQELGGLAAVSLDHNTAFHLEAVLTPDSDTLKRKGQTRIDHYAEIIVERADQLSEYAQYLAVDAYFSKEKFVKAITENTELEVVGKLRCDANLNYLYKGKQRKGKGRPRKYDGKIDTKKIDKRRFKLCYQDDNTTIYELVVWSVQLKREIKVAYVEWRGSNNGKIRYGVFFSTDLTLSGKRIYDIYRSRFQIEFLYRDAKQFVGLTHCQARSENKIHFHCNASLTTVNLAKTMHLQNQESEQQKPFSMSDYKTKGQNQHMMNLFFTKFGINPNLEKNQPLVAELAEYGLIAT